MYYVCINWDTHVWLESPEEFILLYMLADVTGFETIPIWLDNEVPQKDRSNFVDCINYYRSTRNDSHD